MKLRLFIFLLFLLSFSVTLFFPRGNVIISKHARRRGANHTLLSEYSCDNNVKAPTCFATNLCVSLDYGIFITVPDGTDVGEFSKSMTKAALINIYSVVDQFWAPDVRTQSEVKKWVEGGAYVNQLEIPLLVKMPLWYHHVAHFVKDMLAPAYGTNITLDSHGKIPALLIIDTPYFEHSRPAYPLNVFFGMGIIHYEWLGAIVNKWRGGGTDGDYLPSSDITCFATAQLGAPHNPFTPLACQRMQTIGWRWAEVTKQARTILIIRRLETRVWYNLDECAEVLHQHFPAYRIVIAELAQVSKQDQIKLFYEADLVIAVHGNSLGNVVWMRPRTFVLELMQFGWTAGNYFKEFSTPCLVNHTVWQCPSRECQDPTSHARNQVHPKSFGLLMNSQVLVGLVKHMLYP